MEKQEYSSEESVLDKPTEVKKEDINDCPPCPPGVPGADKCRIWEEPPINEIINEIDIEVARQIANNLGAKLIINNVGKRELIFAEKKV